MNINPIEKELKSKIIEFSGIIEQNFEEILNELLANNYKRFEYSYSSLAKNYTNGLYDEIHKLIESILLKHENKSSARLKDLFKKNSGNFSDFIPRIIRMVKFVNYLKDVSNAILLIKINITELYRYPAFKKQAYIPDFTLALSSFFKKNTDHFFSGKNNQASENDNSHEELGRILSLGHKIINEFFLHLTLDGAGNFSEAENQVIYYSNIISLLEMIAMSCFEFSRM